MLKNLFDLSLSPANLAVRAVVVFLFVVVLLRISGKRQMGQMGATEFVAILLISNAVQNAMNGGDNSLVGGLLLAAVLIFVSWSISVLTFRFAFARTIFEGTPTLIIHKGLVLEKNLAKERLTHQELKTLMRKQGIHNYSDVATGVLESDGTLSIAKVSE